MACTHQFGCAATMASLLLILIGPPAKLAGQTDSGQPPQSCSCPDGRQFSVGSALFGENSARVVITGFRRDLAQPGPPSCKDLTVVGQTVRLQVLTGHPFLRRENRKTGTISEICQTHIQFAQPNKSYDFFKDDGSAVTLSDIEAAQTPAEKGAGPQLDSSASPGDSRNDDLTGKDLIRMLPGEDPREDPGSTGFDVNDLKEGAYCIVRRQVKAAPAVDDAGAGRLALPANPERELTIRAGSLGRIEKRAGFRNGPLWLVDVLPHSAPLSFSAYLRSLPSAFRKHQPPQRKFVLTSDDVVEINHFFDKYSLEWTRFGDDSEDVRKRELAGTTILPGIYSAPRPTLEETLQNAKKMDLDRDIRKAAMRLTFILKHTESLRSAGTLVLDDENGPGAAAPHYFHQQCFVGGYQGPNAGRSPVFRVSDADVAIFQPYESPQVPKDYFAVDVRLQLKSDGAPSLPVVCRFPSAAIDETLLDSAQRILSPVFSIAPSRR